MKELLKKALQAVQDELKNAQSFSLSEPTVRILKEAGDSLKKLPCTGEGIFDMVDVDEDVYKAGGLIYPVYACYETICNKKEDYPDLLKQIHIMEIKLKQDFTYAHGAAFLYMLIQTIQGVSEEIYEYYRELIDIFRDVVRRIMEEFPEEAETGAGDDETDRLFCSAIETACENYVLLKEKYHMLYN